MAVDLRLHRAEAGPNLGGAVGHPHLGEEDGGGPNQGAADGADPNRDAADGGDPNQGAVGEADRFQAVRPSDDDRGTMACPDTSDPNNFRTGR